MKHAGELRGAGAAGCRRLERVVALVRVEEANLVPEDDLVIDEDVRPSADVVDEVDIEAGVGVPFEALVAARNGLGRQVKVVMRQELRCWRRLRRSRERRLRASVSGQSQAQARGRGRVPYQRSGGVRHAPSFSSSSAMRCSRSTTRFFRAGNCRKIADDFSHSRFAMAGYPETN